MALSDLISPLASPFGASAAPAGPASGPLATKGQMTPQQIALLRQQALAWQQPPKENYKSWTQVVAHLMDAMNAKSYMTQAAEGEKAGLQSSADDTSALYAPYLSPAAGPAPSAAMGAPAGGAGVPSGGAAPRADAGNFAPAIASIESGGEKDPYSAIGPSSGSMGHALGKYQVMEANVPEWTKEIFGKEMTPAEFLANPQAQDAVFNNKFGSYVSKYGPEGAAKAWFAGERGMNNPDAKDSLGTSVASYAEKFRNATGAQPPQEAAAFAPQQNPLSPMISAMAGRPMPPPNAPGVPQQAAMRPPMQVAQVVPPAAAAPPGPPAPLTPPVGQMTQMQLHAIIANPWVQDSMKSNVLQMIQQRGQVQTRPVPGGTQYFTANGQTQFIPDTKIEHIEAGNGVKVPILLTGQPDGSYKPSSMLPQGKPGAGGAAEPDLSTIGGMQKNVVEQAAAKKGAEETATTSAKMYNTIHTGITGDAVNAARQSPLLDTLTELAPAAMTGNGSEAKLGLARIANQLGIDPKGAAPAELFRMLSNKVLDDIFAGIRNASQEEGSPGGRVFKSQLDVAEKSAITRDDTVEGVLAKLSYMKHSGERAQRWADLADDYAKEHGRLDAGFMKSLRHDMANTKFENPLAKQAAPGAPAPGGPDRAALEAEARKRGLPGYQTPAPLVSQ